MTAHPPDIEYARGKDINIAYQVFGEGPRDVVIQLSHLAHLEYLWELPAVARMFRRLARLGRVAIFNQRGIGLSDPVVEPPSLEQRAADIELVMDALGSDQAVLISMSESGPVAVHFAATRPDRVEALLLYGTFAKRAARPGFLDQAEGLDAPDVAALYEVFETHWGTGSVGARSAPSLAADEAHLKWLGKLERASASPQTFIQLGRAALEADVRDRLADVRAPTLVVHRTDDPLNPLAEAKELAAGIPGAKFVELEGSDHAIYVDADQVLDEMEAFVLGSPTGVDPDQADGAILFTDIVDSTGNLADVGDVRWHQVLDRHDRLLGACFQRHGSIEVHSTGDGFMAYFSDAADAALAGREALGLVGESGISIRAGVDSGSIRLIGNSVGGMVVHTAARVCGAAGANEVLVTEPVRDALADRGLDTVERGTFDLKGVPGARRLWLVWPASE